MDSRKEPGPIRKDALGKVTGEAIYAGDLRMADMLTARVLRSPFPRARIARIDTSRAEAHPGVVGVLTAEDVRDVDPYFGPAFRDQPLIAIGKVRYEGEPIAVVVAEDPSVAEFALSRIDVEYEELELVLDPVEAMREGSPILHKTLRASGHFAELGTLRDRGGSNICHHYHYDKGDVEAGLREADLVLADTFSLPPIHTVPLEPFVAIARCDADGVTVWSSTQHPFPVRKDIAQIFRLPLNMVRVIVPFVGGSFGGKAYTKIEPLAAAVARKFPGRPIKLELSMEESFKVLVRHGARIHSQVGVKSDGTLIAKKVEVILDTGAYADMGPRVANQAGLRAPGPYRIPNVRVDCYAVYTNTVPAGSYRGFGAPQVMWACESQMDTIAEHLGIDPVEIRMRNLLDRGEVYVPGRRPMDSDLRDMLKRAARLINWETTIKEGDGKPRGRGIAVGFKNGGGVRTISSAAVRLYADGCASVLIGSVEVGQGVWTAMSQIVSQELGLSIEKVRIDPLDTSVSPYDQATSMSRTTVSMGHAVKRAAEAVRRQLMDIASNLWGVPIDQLSIRDGQVRRGSEGLSFSELIQEHFGMPVGELVGHGVVGNFDEEMPVGDRSFWETAVAATEVEVDEATGKVKVHKYVSVVDAGRAIVRELCEAQDEGASMQGIGSALYEELAYEDGQLINPNLIDYRVPTFEDLPAEFHSEVVEHGGGSGPYGAKGVSESGNIPTAPAIANAVARAVGVRIKELPLSPERVWLALQARKAEEKTRGQS